MTKVTHLNAGSNCKYVLSNGGMFSNETVAEFRTEQELDNYIESLLNDHAINIDGGKVILSVDLMAKSRDILNDIKTTMTSIGEEVHEFNAETEEEITYLKIPNSIGTNNFISTAGKNGDPTMPIITPFSVDVWAEQYRTKHGTSPETEAAIEAQKKLWPQLTQYGTDIHEVIDATFKGEEYKRTSKTVISDSQIVETVAYAKQLMKDLRTKHGATCEFYTEFGFVSKELDDKIKPILEAMGKTSINGKADLLVLDEFGNVHIYDFKVSRKTVGDWSVTDNRLLTERNFEKGIEGDWHTTKKLGATNQLAIYKAILGQYGLHVSSGNIIPIKVNFNYKNEFEIESIESIKFPSFSENILNVPGSTAGSVYRNIADNILPQPNIITGTGMQKTYDIWQQFCPGVKGGSIRKREQTIDSLKRNGFVKTLNSSDRRFPEYKYSFMPWGVGKRKIACKTEEELNEELLKYINKRNASEANELTDLGELIDVEIHGEKDYTKIVGNVAKENQIILQEQFKKYFKQDWDFNNDTTLISAGIFMFTKGDQIEIVVMTNEGLFDTMNLGVGNTILGKNTKNKHVGLRNILPASNANLAMMKAMIFISENQQMFKGKKIVQVRAFNPWRGELSDNVTTTTLLQNYDQLRLRNQNVDAQAIDSSIFMSDIESTIALIQSKWEMLDTTMVDFDEKYDASQVESVTEWANKSLAQLKETYKELENTERQRSSVAWEAYALLNELLLRLNRIEQTNEIDPEPWAKGINLGLNVTSAQFSNSKNIQEFARLHDRYVAEVRNAVQKQGFAMQKMFRELYEKTGVTGAKAFESWFVRNPDGSISDEFRLKDPESPEIASNPTVKKAMEMLLETMYKIRYPNALDSDVENAKETGDYYKVPLMEAVFSRQAKNLGFFKAVRNKIDQYKELTEGVFAGESDEKEKWERDNDSLYNKFRLDPITRARKIDKHGVGFFETNLEIVFNNVIVAYNKQQISEKYVPLFKAMQIGLRKMDEDGGNNLEQVRKTLDKLIDNRFYGKNIMEGEGLKKWYAFLSVISRVFSTMKLGLNVRSFLRETLSGMYIGATRVMVKQHNNVSLDSYNKAVAYVIQDLPNNPSGISLVQQLNAMYGMANYSLGNVANQRKVNWLNINNWGHDTLFIGCSAPDYQHRMAILIAKMMDDGCWDALSTNENDELVYDFKKDKRFEAYIKGDITNSKYLEQKTLYLKNLEEWNAQGYRKPDGTTLKEGDDLPQPYTNREGQSIKNYADILYGHYDDESRSLMNDMFIGTFFMQYKTFVTAKLEQWTMEGGVYNIEYLKQQYDPLTGEKLYEIMRYPNPDGTGVPTRNIIKESVLKDLPKEDREQARPYIEWTGQPMEGMARSAWNMAKAIRHMSKEELDEIWNDPHERGLLLLGMSDLFLMGLIGLIIQALFGAAVGSEEWSDINYDVRNSNYFTSLSYNVLRGVTRDNSIFSVIQSMGADMNPPFLTNLKQFGQSCYAVSVGNQSLAYALTRNIGAVSDFSGMVKQWEELQKAVE